MPKPAQSLGVCVSVLFLLFVWLAASNHLFEIRVRVRFPFSAVRPFTYPFFCPRNVVPGLLIFRLLSDRSALTFSLFPHVGSTKWVRWLVLLSWRPCPTGPPGRIAVMPSNALPLPHQDMLARTDTTHILLQSCLPLRLPPSVCLLCLYVLSSFGAFL